MGISRAFVGLLVVATAAGCATAQPATSPTPPAASPPPVSFDPYVGAYRTDGGVTLVVNGHGHLFNLADDTIRQLYAGADHFTVGPAFQVERPRQADVAFHLSGPRADRLTETPVRGTPLAAARLPFKETDVTVHAQGADLAATVTEPLGPGPHPGIVIVHGSGYGPRIDYGLWVGLYADLGFTVLAYDKRGNGRSTGAYPGEAATAENLGIYADDAAATLRFLSAWPGVDPHRVGYHGGSQGGWVVPLALRRFPAAAFAVLVSGPAVSVGQQGLWADLAAGSSPRPAPSIMAELRASGGGYDPAPVLAATTQPVLWLNGEIDHNVPTALNTEILHGLARPNFEVQVLPGVDHGLLENPPGGDDARAGRLATGLFDRIATWLAAHAGGAPRP
ncbi:MAG TPA: alpha/beta hydrolase [Candidatus Dormibacteraeota bacterium]|nr:alpha/beta hydrolase [Candidatus Dormibacteraeota bacterium]